MDQEIYAQFDRLIAAVSALPEVRSVGKSGGSSLPQAGESDVDIFVFCETVPKAAERQGAVRALGDCVTGCRIGETPSRHWGTCDFVDLDGAEICLMYYPISEMNAEIDAVLSGARLDKEDNYFYPTGRLASFLSLHILCDKQGYIASMKERLSAYPAELAKKLMDRHLNELEDTEDLERAVARKDALFYHFALDLSLDHFLQALFAMNQCYFPSRKRTIQHVQAFSKKPEQCSARLQKILELGAKAETIPQSYDEFSSLCSELSALSRTIAL